MSFTPGPWVREGTFVYALQDNGARNPDGSPVLVNRFSVQVQNAWPYAPVEELEANARLIAAAPDLLAVAQEVSQSLSVDYRANAYLCERLSRVLDKAEGRARP